jgi:hypothetical protein
MEVPMSTGMILTIVGAVILIVALLGLLVFLRRRDAAKGQDKAREGELVQELAAVAVQDDPTAAVAAAPSPEAAAALAAAAITPPEAIAAMAITEPPVPVAVAVPTEGAVDVPVPDATAPLDEAALAAAAAAAAEEAAQAEMQPVVEEVAEPVVEEVLEPVAEPVVEEVAPIVVAEPELEPEPEPEPELPPLPVPPVVVEPAPAPLAVAPQATVTSIAPVVQNETTQAASVVAAQLRKLADQVESEAQVSSDGFRVFDVVLDGFATLPVGLLLPEDEAIAASGAFAAPSSVSTLRVPTY